MTKDRQLAPSRNDLRKPDMMDREPRREVAVFIE